MEIIKYPLILASFAGVFFLSPDTTAARAARGSRIPARYVAERFNLWKRDRLYAVFVGLVLSFAALLLSEAFWLFIAVYGCSLSVLIGVDWNQVRGIISEMDQS